MAYRNAFRFDGSSSSLFAVFISGEGTYNGTARDVTEIEIPGRNGTLVLDNVRYQNIDLTYPAFIVDSFNANFQALRSFLLSKTGYCRLEDDYHPDEFRLARYRGNIQPKMTQFNREGEFEISFNCKPQRFLVTGETVQTFTADGTITNPELFEARPLIRVYGAGDLGIGSDTITIAAHSYPYIDIDTDVQDCYYQSNNCNGYVTITGDMFPGLKAGATGIDLGTGITKVEITPRWWRL